MRAMRVKAPFPWFGGKRRVAPEVWAALGDVPNYVEPFAGSLAVLLERPTWHRGRTETINDKDRYVANFWRAIQKDPEGVACYASDPVNEADLLARHRWLVDTGAERIASIEDDPAHYDPMVAGWWVWGISAWIGSGWCAGRGVHRQLPHLGGTGKGVHRKRPHLGNAGQGVHRRRPHLNAGQGVNRQLPGSSRRIRITDYLRALAERLEDVRVCCGDWTRVVTRGALSHGSSVGSVGVFLDPPYAADLRDSRCYAVDDVTGGTLSAKVREWAVTHGDDPRLRIVLAGYEDEHAEHMPSTWRVHAWTGSGGYSKPDSRSLSNRHKERLWLSPGCLRPEQEGLFE